MRLFANIFIFIVFELFIAALVFTWLADLSMKYYLSAIGGICITILLFMYVNDDDHEHEE